MDLPSTASTQCSCCRLVRRDEIRQLPDGRGGLGVVNVRHSAWSGLRARQSVWSVRPILGFTEPLPKRANVTSLSEQRGVLVNSYLLSASPLVPSAFRNTFFAVEGRIFIAAAAIYALIELSIWLCRRADRRHKARRAHAKSHRHDTWHLLVYGEWIRTFRRRALTIVVASGVFALIALGV